MNERDLADIPLSEWTDQEIAAFELQFGWSPPAMSTSQLQSFTLGEPTDPPVAALSRTGFSLDTVFIAASTHIATTLRREHAHGRVSVSAVPTTETSGGALRVVTLYQATVFNDAQVAYTVIPITYQTYTALLKNENAGDDEAYNDGADVTYTTTQSKFIDEEQPDIIVEDRMSHLEGDTDGAGRKKEFRADTRWPANPLTGEPNPDYP